VVFGWSRLESFVSRNLVFCFETAVKCGVVVFLMVWREVGWIERFWLILIGGDVVVFFSVWCEKCLR
jgi:hypothetical protein